MKTSSLFKICGLLAACLLTACAASAQTNAAKPKVEMTPAQAAASRQRAAALAERQRVLLHVSGTRLAISGTVERTIPQGLLVLAVRGPSKDNSPRFVGRCLLVGFGRKLADGERLEVGAFPDGVFMESRGAETRRKFNLSAASVTEPADAETFASLNATKATAAAAKK